MLSFAHALSALATICCGVFAGAAIYINAVEHPARMSCGVSIGLAQWAPSYARATVMQASLAVLGFLLALGSWWTGAPTLTLVAGVVLILVAPFTLIVIMPINKRLLSLNVEQDSAEVAALLKRWNQLHGVRSALSLSAFAMFLFAGR